MPDRLFVAIWPDPAARESLSTLVDAARGALPDPDLRWQPPQRWHVTLAFLGPADLPRATERVAALRLPAPEPLRLAGAGSFGPVLWVGVEHGTWLAALVHDLQAALRVEDRRFRAHVTVARARGRDPRATTRAALPLLAAHRGPQWAPDALTLVRSVTGPSPRYEVVAGWPLPRGGP